MYSIKARQEAATVHPMSGFDLGRRALANVGGEAAAGGDLDEGERLAEILRAATPDDADWMTHGFHSYPARMHPGVARGVLDRYAVPGDRVLDPFCGSGTVLVEGLVAGMRTRGIDLNPIAIRLCGVKCQLRDAASRVAFSDRLHALVEASKHRVRTRALAMAPLSPQERNHYDVHVLKELAGLHALIGEVDSVPDRAALQMLLTAIVVKFSKQRADTSTRGQGGTRPRRVGKFVPSEFYGRKGDELLDRWAELEAACSEGWVRPKVVEGDATKLRDAVPPNWRAHLILTSPPYGGTYDYVQHHARRYPWLGVSPKRFAQAELGARRTHTRGPPERWDSEVVAMLTSMFGVLDDAGQIILLMGDGEVGGTRVELIAQLHRLAPQAGLRVVAWASQPRVDWNRGEPREEHLVLLRR